MSPGTVTGAHSTTRYGRAQQVVPLFFVPTLPGSPTPSLWAWLFLLTVRVEVTKATDAYAATSERGRERGGGGGWALGTSACKLDRFWFCPSSPRGRGPLAYPLRLLGGHASSLLVCK